MDGIDKMKTKEQNLKTLTTSRSEFIEEELERNIEKALNLTISNYGEIYEIIEQNGDNEECRYVI
jgi:hypothetical protein